MTETLETREKRQMLPGSTWREATASLLQLRAQAEREVNLKAMGHKAETVSDYAQRWSEDLGRRVEQRRITKGTAVSHIGNMETFVLPYFGRMNIHDVVPKDVTQWFRWLELLCKPTLRQGRGRPYTQEPLLYAPRTLRSAWQTFRPFFRWVSIQADLHRNPLSQVRMDIRAGESAVKATLTRSEVNLLLHAMRHETLKFQCQTVIALAGAMRHSEVSALHWSDVNLEGACLQITRSQRCRIVGPPKTEASRRTVTLPPVAVQMLRELRKWQEATNDPGLAKDRIFANGRGNYIEVHSCNNVLKRAAARAGIEKKVTTHVLRRTTNNLVRKHSGSLVAMAMTGHVTEEMHRHYSEVDLEERAGAIELAFAGALSRVPEPVLVAPQQAWLEPDLDP